MNKEQKAQNQHVSQHSSNEMLPAVESGTLRPILFSTEMVRAILDNRKTQTRRIVKSKTGFFKVGIDKQTKKVIDIWATDADEFEVGTVKCPYGSIGDILWVRETHSKEATIFSDTDAAFIYKADSCVAESEVKWKPSLFMPYAACRIWLKIIDIRIEKLQAISEIDALQEGVKFVLDKVTGYCGFDYKNGGYNIMTTPIKSYKSLWGKINGEGSWSENPFVWVIEFERCVHP